MAGITQVRDYLGIITEIDLRPIQREATQEIKIALVGAPRPERDLLADQMRLDPSRPDLETDTPILVLDLNAGQLARQADVVILLLDGLQSDFGREKELARQWADAGLRVLVFVLLAEKPIDPNFPLPLLPWKPRYVVYGSMKDASFLQQKFAPTMIHLLPDKLLALGRNFPFFRVPIARYLINDTSQSNAAYSLATGLAEIVPILNIPLVVTDMIILTKNQAFLAYKLGLVFGFTTEWKSYVGEFGSVLGFGFLFRQFARTLIGLIPGFGIIPKVGVAYAGTVVVGNTVMQWYLTGRHLSSAQLKGFYSQAYLAGKKVAAKLLPGVPRRKPKALPEGQPDALPQPKATTTPARWSKHACPQCGRASARDAHFCQYCGYAFTAALPPAGPPAQ